MYVLEQFDPIRLELLSQFRQPLVQFLVFLRDWWQMISSIEEEPLILQIPFLYFQVCYEVVDIYMRRLHSLIQCPVPSFEMICCSGPQISTGE